MKTRLTVLLCFTLIALAGTARAQRGGTDWMTESGDAQRSAWVRSDGKINKTTMAKPGFQFLWKHKTKNVPRQLNALTPPATLERLIGYRGFRMLGFFAGSGDNLYTLDTDLGRLEWEVHLKSGAPARPGTIACPGGLTTGVVRPVLAAIPPAPTGTGGGGRSTPAKSGVGDPGQGAVTLAMVRPNPPAPPAPPPSAAPRPNPANPPVGQFGAGPFLVYALASDGMLHSMHLSNGAEFQAPIKFTPPNANAQGLIVVEQVAYATTTNGCGGAPNGLWALDLATKQTASWKGNVVGTAGPAFGGDGVAFVATGAGGELPNSVVALDPKSLAVKGSFSAGRELASSPVVFDHKGKTLVAVAAADGSLHLLDGADLKRGALASTPAAGSAPGALASWQDLTGTRWLLTTTKTAVVAWKLVEQGSGFSLQSGWTSRELVSPLTPTIINGVVFAVSSGEVRADDAKTTVARSKPAVIYALDGTTGKELWSSGNTITSFAHGGAISGGMGQIYLTTYDGTIWAFGFPMEH